MNSIRSARRYLVHELEDYTARLNDDITRQLVSVLSGDINKINQRLLEGSDDTKKGAYVVAANKDLHALAQSVAPQQLRALAMKHESGQLKAQDENMLMGQLADAVNTAVKQAVLYKRRVVPRN